jgi:osmotically-inducible protein OsmY
MKRQISYAIAALLAAGGISLASAQNANPAASMNFVQEPVASATKQGSRDQVVTSIVNALNGDASLQHSKISVQSDQGTVILTGVTLTQAQKKQAVQIAASQAGPTKVVDAMQSDDV